MIEFIKSTRILFLLFVAVIACMPSYAGQTWLTWNEYAGLPGNNLSCLAIKKGMMVVGSDKGIGIFCDDYTSWFKLADYCEILRDVPIKAMDFDDHGVLWAATPLGAVSIDLNDFPERTPQASFFNTAHGLPTVDVESLQIHENKLYIGCFGGWLASAEIQPGGGTSAFRLENNRSGVPGDSNKIMSVGISAMAMDYPGGGIYSTRGSGLISAESGQNAIDESLASDWVDDFLAFEAGNTSRIVAVTQDKINLIGNRKLVGELTLPVPDCWISCIALASHQSEDGYKKPKVPGYLSLEAHIGKSALYIGTKGRGLWRFADGRWSNFTTRDSPLPSDVINKIYYLHGAGKIAVLSEGGLTMFGAADEKQFDAFEYSGSAPFYASTIWPFMSRWGPYVYGYPYQQSYPIDNFIAYGRICRGKDLWVAHAKGISRFVFPSSPFIGAMQYQYHLATRYENPENNPVSSILLEDSSTSADQPLPLEGEYTWHHYCLEQPDDVCAAPLDDIWVTPDLKFIVGPQDQIATFVAQPGQEVKGINVAKASGTPVIIKDDERFNAAGERLVTVASLYLDCPVHQIPSENVKDMVLDLSERPFVIFDDNRLACLDSPVNETVPDPKQNWWHVFSPDQLPWEQFDELYLIARVNSDLYVSGEKSGLFFLPMAHSFAAATVKSSDWRRITLPQAEDRPEMFVRVISISRWVNKDGEFVALLHPNGLSLYDGESLKKVGIAERAYTSMVADRLNNLWVGSKNGLLCISPDLEQKETLDGSFNSKHVVHMSAAPDNARYPYTLAVVVDGRAHLLQYSDPPPMLYVNKKSDSRHRLSVGNSEVFGGGQILLYDGQKWEALPRPGVLSLHFDQSYLWVSTTCRVIRLFMPVQVETY